MAQPKIPTPLADAANLENQVQLANAAQPKPDNTPPAVNYLLGGFNPLLGNSWKQSYEDLHWNPMPPNQYHGIMFPGQLPPVVDNPTDHSFESVLSAQFRLNTILGPLLSHTIDTNFDTYFSAPNPTSYATNNNNAIDYVLQNKDELLKLPAGGTIIGNALQGKYRFMTPERFFWQMSYDAAKVDYQKRIALASTADNIVAGLAAAAPELAVTAFIPVGPIAGVKNAFGLGRAAAEAASAEALAAKAGTTAAQVAKQAAGGNLLNAGKNLAGGVLKSTADGAISGAIGNAAYGITRELTWQSLENDRSTLESINRIYGDIATGAILGIGSKLAGTVFEKMFPRKTEVTPPSGPETLQGEIIPPPKPFDPNGPRLFKDDGSSISPTNHGGPLAAEVPTKPMTIDTTLPPEVKVGSNIVESTHVSTPEVKATATPKAVEEKLVSDYIAKHDDGTGTVPAREPYLPTRDEAFAEEINRPGPKNFERSHIDPTNLSAQKAIELGDKLGYRPEDIAAYLKRNYTTEGIAAREAERVALQNKPLPSVDYTKLGLDEATIADVTNSITKLKAGERPALMPDDHVPADKLDELRAMKAEVVRSNPESFKADRYPKTETDEFVIDSHVQGKINERNLDLIKKHYEIMKNDLSPATLLEDIRGLVHNQETSDLADNIAHLYNTYFANEPIFGRIGNAAPGRNAGINIENITQGRRLLMEIVDNFRSHVDTFNRMLNLEPPDITLSPAETELLQNLTQRVNLMSNSLRRATADIRETLKTTKDFRNAQREIESNAIIYDKYHNSPANTEANAAYDKAMNELLDRQAAALAADTGPKPVEPSEPSDPKLNAQVQSLINDVRDQYGRPVEPAKSEGAGGQPPKEPPKAPPAGEPAPEGEPSKNVTETPKATESVKPDEMFYPIQKNPATGKPEGIDALVKAVYPNAEAISHIKPDGTFEIITTDGNVIKLNVNDVIRDFQRIPTPNEVSLNKLAVELGDGLDRANQLGEANATLMSDINAKTLSKQEVKDIVGKAALVADIKNTIALGAVFSPQVRGILASFIGFAPLGALGSPYKDQKQVAPDPVNKLMADFSFFAHAVDSLPFNERVAKLQDTRDLLLRRRNVDPMLYEKFINEAHQELVSSVARDPDYHNAVDTVVKMLGMSAQADAATRATKIALLPIDVKVNQAIQYYDEDKLKSISNQVSNAVDTILPDYDINESLSYVYNYVSTRLTSDGEKIAWINLFSEIFAPLSRLDDRHMVSGETVNMVIGYAASSLSNSVNGTRGDNLSQSISESIVADINAYTNGSDRPKYSSVDPRKNVLLDMVAEYSRPRMELTRNNDVIRSGILNNYINRAETLQDNVRIIYGELPHLQNVPANQSITRNLTKNYSTIKDIPVAKPTQAPKENSMAELLQQALLGLGTTTADEKPASSKFYDNINRAKIEPIELPNIMDIKLEQSKRNSKKDNK